MTMSRSLRLENELIFRKTCAGRIGQFIVARGKGVSATKKT
jgi:hypothetical protein